MRTLGLSELEEYAAKFALRISPHRSRATLVALSGDLGAGKTTFAQAVAKTLGVEERVTSPTFGIEKIYELHGQQFARLVHIDAYRLEDAGELEKLGFSALLRDPQNLILLEWPENVSKLVPKNAVKIRFDIAGQKRTISIDGQGEANSE